MHLSSWRGAFLVRYTVKTLTQETGGMEAEKYKKKVDLERSVRYLAFEKRFLESHKKSVLFGAVVTFGPYFAA